MTKRTESKPVDAKPQVPAMGEFVKHHEQQAAKKGLVVTQITHPDASGGIHQGRHAGIRTRKGEPQAVYNDGSKH